jgi:hypothetical protein
VHVYSLLTAHASLAEEKQGKLFKLVSFITGWKNSLKGAGYFLGAATVSIRRASLLHFQAVWLGIVCCFQPRAFTAGSARFHG